MKNDHPDWQEIVDYIESGGKIPGTIRSHLESCGRCKRLAEEAKQLLSFMAEARLPQPPDSLIKKTFARMANDIAAIRRSDKETAPGPSERLVERLNEIWAVLVGDSLAPNAMVRNSTMTHPANIDEKQPRTLLYDSKGFAIALSILPNQDSRLCDLVGQVTPKVKSETSPETRLGTSPEACPETSPEGDLVLRVGDDRYEKRLTGFGEFNFRNIRRSDLLLDFLIGDELIHVSVNIEYSDS